MFYPSQLYSKIAQAVLLYSQHYTTNIDTGLLRSYMSHYLALGTLAPIVALVLLRSVKCYCVALSSAVRDRRREKPLEPSMSSQFWFLYNWVKSMADGNKCQCVISYREIQSEIFILEEKDQIWGSSWLHSIYLFSDCSTVYHVIENYEIKTSGAPDNFSWILCGLHSTLYTY